MTAETEALTYDHIVALALSHGFKLKPQTDGRMALNDYVIDFARAVYDIGYAAAKAETAAAVAAERKKCAQVCDRLYVSQPWAYDASTRAAAARDCAAAIRARDATEAGS